jgi:hypothetical protein
MRTAGLIESFCDDYGYEYRDNYSGRGMFGKECAGIVTDENVLQVVLALSDYMHECGIDCVKDELGRVCYDNMGLDVVIYFPSISSE